MLHIILGPTCSGKNALARCLAPKLNAEIISVDSMKIYCRMNIGTAKPTTAQRKAVPYHLIDIVDPNQTYNAAQFLQDCEAAMAKITKKGKLPLLAVGTPMYLKVLLYGMFTGPAQDNDIRQELEGLSQTKGPEHLHKQLARVDPAKAEQLHPNDLKRIIRALEVFRLTGQPISKLQTHFKSQTLRYPVRIIGLERDRDELYQRINDRVNRMFEQGLVKEVKSLLRKYKKLSPQAAQAVGYKEVIAHIKDGIPLTEAIDTVKKNSRHFARRQISWFHKFPEVKWIDVKETDKVDKIAKLVQEEWRGKTGK
ncbi:MAG: tRNA (adenosine(37)-N6)-dimethylallyltransferase MiaA [Candidatus Brocadiia bacterium]